MPTVCAIVHGADPPLARAVAAQDRAPDTVVGAAMAPGDKGATWLWILDGSALPRPTALSALLAAADRLDDEAVNAPMLASRVVTPAGGMAPEHAPLSPQDQTRLAIVVAPARVLPARAVTAASVLVRPAAVSARLPAGPAAAMAWSARILRSTPGFLVPDSVADVRARVPRARVQAALLFGDGLRGRERMRVGMDLLEHGLARASAREPARGRARGRAGP